MTYLISRANLYIFILLSLTLVTNACKKSEVKDPIITEEIPKLKFTIKDIGQNLPRPDVEGFQDYNYLGYGYDVTGKYSHRTSIKNPILETPALANDNSAYYSVVRVLMSSFESIYAEDALQLTKSLLGKDASMPGYFKGNITQPFPDTDPNSNRYIYGLYDVYMKYKKFTIYANNNILTNHLTQTFSKDIELMTAAELVDKYGTHVILSLYTGAKLSIDYKADFEGINRRQAVENSFRVGLAEGFNLFSGFLDPVDSSALKNVASPYMAFEAIGGDPSKIIVDKNPQLGTKVNINGWLESIAEGNARFIYIDDLNTLTPISDLISDSDKKHQLQSYIDQYIKSHEIKLNNDLN